MSTEKVEILASAEMVESRRVLKKGRNPGEYRKSEIRASTGKVEIWASAEKVESGQVPERWVLGEYRKGWIWASTGEGSG